MAELGIRGPMLVKDIMSSPVITIQENEPADKAAVLMEKREVGCIIVTAENERPIGIITERDFVTRIVARDLQPSKVTVKEIMSAPLITIGPDETLNEAARRMSRLNIRRLGVIYKGRLEGIISSKDILAIMPELIEIIQEKTRIENQGISEEILERPPLAGYCDNCSQWSDNLIEVEGNFLCEDCRLELEREE
ncbi:MAG: cyclic nucleotide-binding/CBS domain-containing protein [Candidatus Bathyarchaeia archaeon]